MHKARPPVEPEAEDERDRRQVGEARRDDGAAGERGGKEQPGDDPAPVDPVGEPAQRPLEHEAPGLDGEQQERGLRRREPGRDAVDRRHRDHRPVDQPDREGAEHGGRREPEQGGDRELHPGRRARLAGGRGGDRNEREAHRGGHQHQQPRAFHGGEADGER